MNRRWLFLSIAAALALTAVSRNLAQEPPAAPQAVEKPPQPTAPQTPQAPPQPTPPQPTPPQPTPPQPTPPQPTPPQPAPPQPAPPEIEPSPAGPPPDRDEQLKIFSLQHARAVDMEKIVVDLLDDEGVRTSTDRRTNSLLVRGSAANLDAIEAMLKRLDEPLSRPQPAANTKGQPDAAAIRNLARGAAVVAWTLSDGDKVKQGDLLLKLEAGELESELQRATTEYAQLEARQKSHVVEQKQHAARIDAELQNANAELQRAKTALESFTRGEKMLAEKQLASETALAQAALSLAQTQVASAEREYKIKEAKAALEIAELKQQVFQTITSPREIALLEAEIQIAAREAELLKSRSQAAIQQDAVERDALDAEREELGRHIQRLKEDLKNYQVTAPHAGTVQFPRPIAEGAVVRQGQILLLIAPDPQEQ